MFRQNNRVAARAEPWPCLQPVKTYVWLFVERDAGVVAGGEVAGSFDVARGKGFPLASRPRTVPANDAADFAGREFNESFHVISKRKGHGRQMKKPPGGLPLELPSDCGGLSVLWVAVQKAKKISQSLLSASDNLEVE